MQGGGRRRSRLHGRETIWRRLSYPRGWKGVNAGEPRDPWRARHSQGTGSSSFNFFPHPVQQCPMWPPYPSTTHVQPAFQLLAPKLLSAWGNEFNTHILWQDISLPLPLHSFHTACMHGCIRCQFSFKGIRSRRSCCLLGLHTAASAWLGRGGGGTGRVLASFPCLMRFEALLCESGSLVQIDCMFTLMNCASRGT